MTNYKFEHNTDHLCEENNERKLFYCCQDQDTKVKNDIDAMELKFTDWRFGPAKLWYDMINLPETTINFFDYGFELSHAKVIVIYELKNFICDALHTSLRMQHSYTCH